MNLAKDLLETCNRMYTDMPTGLSPEIAYFNLGNEGSKDIIVKVCFSKRAKVSAVPLTA